MIKNYSVLAIVPARGGSKRIPGKNIKELAGKPLIAYTFEEGQKSKYIDRTILVTDDDEIIKFSKRYTVEVPFKEPPELVADDVKDFDFFSYYLMELEKREGYKPDIVVQLRPTSPLRVASEIDAAIELLANHPEADSVRTVAEPEQSPYKMYKVEDDGYLRPLLVVPNVAESFNMPGQKLPKAYKHVGYVDVIWRKTIIEKKQMTGEKILPLVLKDALSGLNTTDQWEWYEYLFNKRRDA